MSVRIGTATDKVEIDCAKIEGEDSLASGDLLLLVSVQCRDFSGRIDAWIHREAWSDFIRQLRDLERHRQGSANLESMSPGELGLTVRSTDRAGHMAVQGLIGVRSSAHEIRMEFSPIAFEPTELPEIVRGLARFGSS